VQEVALKITQNKKDKEGSILEIIQQAEIIQKLYEIQRLAYELVTFS
jgi:hypothetical protein